MMKDGWKMVRLGDVCEKTETINPLATKGEYQYIDVSSVSRDTLSVSNTVTINSKNAPSRARRIVKKNDVIFATVRPTLMRIAIIPNELHNQICSTGYVILRHSKEVFHKWLFFCLQRSEFMQAMRSLQRGANYPAVTDSDVKRQQIPLPPLPEQKRIVSQLDAAFAKIKALREKYTRSIELAKETYQSQLQKEMEIKEGWEMKRLGDRDTSCIMYGLTTSSSFEKKKYHLLRITDISSNNIDWNAVPYCNCNSDEINKYELKEGDIVFARTGATTGRSFLLERTFPASLFASYLILVRINSDKFLHRYVRYYFDTPIYWRHINSEIAGAAQGGFNSKKLSNLMIPRPSIPEQQQIVARLDALSVQVSAIKEKYKRSLRDCDELEKSLLDKAFKGEL